MTGMILMLLTVAPALTAVALEKTDLTDAVERVYDTSWIEQAALKYGLIASFCGTQAVTGITEGYHFRSGGGGAYLATGDNYHAYATLRRIGWTATGWMMYANVRNADLSRIGKARRLLGSACYARNCFEWGYKWQRYNNPFDYSEERNQHSLVYFKFSGGKLTDAYIGTGPWNGPAVDAGFLLLGWLLMQ